MRHAVTQFIFLFFIQIYVQAEVIYVNTPVKDQAILKLVNQSVTEILDYNDDKKAGGLDREVENATIFQITKKNNQVTQLRIRSNAVFTTTDYDFGDPVDEIDTVCVTTLSKDLNKSYQVEASDSYCDLKPYRDLNNESSGNPCCDGGPVVDSNMCFDSYEEGLEACSLEKEVVGEYE